MWLMGSEKIHAMFQVHVFLWSITDARALVKDVPFSIHYPEACACCFLFFRLLSAPRQLFWFFWLREPPFGHIRRLGLQTMILSFEIWISSYFFMKFPSKHFETGVFPDGLADTFLCCFVLQVELRIERPGQILKAQSLGSTGTAQVDTKKHCSGWGETRSKVHQTWWKCGNWGANIGKSQR